MSNQSQSRSHYQFRLVKRIDGRKLVTHAILANARSKGARDKTLDIFQASNDRAALQRARDYFHRAVQNKGPLPGEFRGVVVVKYDSDPKKPAIISQPKLHGPLETANRRRQLRGTTTWLYYLDPKGDVFYVDAVDHHVKDQV